MRVSVVQMNQGSDKAANLAEAERLIGAAIDADRPGLVTLPETWTNLGGGRESRRAAAEILPEPGGTGGPAYEMLRGLARAHGITVHGGSIIEDGGEKLFNTTVVFGPDGAEIARYRKIHLFDITAPDGTGYKESALYGGGSDLAFFEAGGIRFACTICYDVRFPELYQELRRRGAEAILVPSNFTLQTGKDHWEVLLRARAIETGSFVLAPAQGGFHEDGRGTWGRTLAVGPWGEVLGKLDHDEPSVLTLDLDLAAVAKARAAIPALANARAFAAPVSIA